MASADPVPFVRTTVTLREDYFQRLKRDPRGLSEALNAILAEKFRSKHDLFGAFPGIGTEDLRDHRDRL